MRASLAALVVIGLAALVLVAASDGDDSAPGPSRAPEAGRKPLVRAIFDRDSSDELAEIRVEHPVHALSSKPDSERVQRIMRGAPRPKPVRKPRKSCS
jgi:hypothetical protein